MLLRESGTQLQAVHVERLPSTGWQRQIERLLHQFGEWRVRTVYCDASGIGDPLAEMLQQSLSHHHLHIRVEPVVFTASTKRTIIETLALAMEQRRVAIPPHPDLLRELHAFTASHSGSGHIRLQARGSEHDDLVIALALAVQAGGKMVPGTPCVRLLTSGRRREVCGV